ncbi:MAG: M20/M25/M40 family metallo-hydrolase [Candidatus Izimaplasma sp.]|nr:M20/M25/M40 family metallo-hydrolase [Candidatus Izimaplasma bacterium]
MIYLYVIIGFIVLIFSIAFFRFLFIKDKTLVDAKPVDLALAKNYAEEFAELIKIKTISFKETENNQLPFIKLKEKLRELFPNVFKTMKVKNFLGEAVLLHWEGKNKDKPIVLMSHLDTVEADEDSWEHKAFSGEIIGDEIYGRGTLDTKSTVYAFYKACEELIKSGYVPDQDIYLFSSTDEEISGLGAKKAVDYLKDNNVKPFLVLDEGGAIVTNALPTVKKPLAMVGILEKGYANIKFSAKSLGGHSSTPPKNTPIARLAKFINDVETKFPLKTKMIKEVEDIFKNAAPYMKGINRFLFTNLWLFRPLITNMLPKISPYGRALLSTTIAFTMIKGSDEENVIPANAYVIANIRTHPIQNVESSFKVLEKIASKYNLESEIISSREASPMTLTDSKAYKYLEENISKVFPDVKTSPYVMLGGTDCRFFNEISEGALRFSPIRMDNSELKKMHGKDESIKINTLVEAVDFYQEIIKNIGGIK